MVALVHPVYDCLIRLAQPDALLNEEEVRENVELILLMLYSFYLVIFLYGTYFFSIHSYIVALILVLFSCYNAKCCSFIITQY